MPSAADSLMILLIEDNLDHAEIIRRRIDRTLGVRLEAGHVTTLGAGIEAVVKRAWDAVLLDLQLPDSRGLETLDRMIAHAQVVPVIVMTSLGDEDLATAALSQGAQDYLVKDNFSREVLSRTIRYAIERKRIEERLKTSLDRVADHAKQLEQLNVRLNEQNADLDNFNHMISHDLREPIRHLLLFSQRIQRNDAKLPAKVRQDLQLIYAAAERVDKSISGLRTLSQTRGIRRTPVRLDRCLSSALEDLSNAIQENQAIVTWDSLPQADADGALVTLLFRNLVSNAMKYCITQPRIHITVERDGTQPVLGVRDNGIGIDPRYAHRVFAPFQRLHGREEYGGGTGLGLAICQKIVAAHGGTIWIDASPGGGTHFKFTLGPGHADRQGQREDLVQHAEVQ